ncbi:hypothetical protein D623_10017942 [Myotis brandtii]|uniref:Uncharacterized protein n=1 Tax=Myotis brandtii TaxID=109478 RepID=S7P2D3_MYOBR|nr:hypothetical protein D623_10017942 [Myotis brandtii]
MLTFAPRTALSAMLVSDAGAITGAAAPGDFVNPQRCWGAEEALAAQCPRLSGVREGTKKGDVAFDRAPHIHSQGLAAGTRIRESTPSARPCCEATRRTRSPLIFHDTR